MQNQDDWLKYDELDAVRYIKNQLPKDVLKNVSDENICDIIELMYDFYEEKGYLYEVDEEIDENEEVEIDVSEMIAYIFERPESEAFRHLTPDDIELIMQGELDYCDSLELSE